MFCLCFSLVLLPCSLVYLLGCHCCVGLRCVVVFSSAFCFGLVLRVASIYVLLLAAHSCFVCVCVCVVSFCVALVCFALQNRWVQESLDLLSFAVLCDACVCCSLLGKLGLDMRREAKHSRTDNGKANQTT